MNLTTFFKATYGLYIISSVHEGRFNGQISNSMVQVSAEPPKVCVALHKDNLTHEFILKSRLFSVAILSQDTPFPFIGKFGFRSGRDIEKFSDLEFLVSPHGLPIIKTNTIGFIEAKVIDTMDAGTHTVFLADALDADIITAGEVLTYDYYHKVLKGKSPEKATVKQI